jgi:outer membrane lipoprotein-sorting protein
MMNRAWFFSLARPGFAAVLLALSLLAPVPGRADVNPSQQAELDKAEAYLNSIGTLKAHFLQVASSGDTAEGTVYLARPGRLRLDYDPPSPVLVVTHGTFLVYYDKQLKQTSYVDVDSTPAGVLVKPRVQLDQGELKVTHVGHSDGLLTVTVIRRQDPSQGSITLIFNEQPLQLRQWRVIDAQGQTTTVSLYDLHPGVKLDNELFVFRDPNDTDVINLGNERRLAP